MSNLKKISLFVEASLNGERQHNKDLDLLIKDFKKYKEGGAVRTFGKDVPYHRPRPMAENAGLMHVHVLKKIKSVNLGAVDLSHWQPNH